MSAGSIDGKVPRVDEPRDGRPGSIGYGPLRPSDELDAPPPIELAAMAQRRLAPLLQRIKDGR
jgi:hypothetical protein